MPNKVMNAAQVRAHTSDLVQKRDLRIITEDLHALTAQGNQRATRC